MTDYVDVKELRRAVYFESATHDQRFLWEEIIPADLPDDHSLIAEVGVVQPLLDGPVIFADNFRRFRLVDCAHRDADRDGDLCTHCGHHFAHKPPTKTAAPRKRQPKK
jgi:hypothetical protein